jgi:hypothetical protein
MIDAKHTRRVAAQKAGFGVSVEPEIVDPLKRFGADDAIDLLRSESADHPFSAVEEGLADAAGGLACAQIP